MTSWLKLSVVGFFILVLSVLPIPALMKYFMPLWGLLFVLYIQYSLPKQFLMLGVMLLGFILDALGGGLLGQHAFSLLASAWFSTRYAVRFRLLAMPQQILGILGFSFLYQTLLWASSLMLGYVLTPAAFICPILMSGLCWPWLQYFGDSLFFSSVR